jgi:hypothetical protein
VIECRDRAEGVSERIVEVDVQRREHRETGGRHGQRGERGQGQSLIQPAKHDEPACEDDERNPADAEADVVAEVAVEHTGHHQVGQYCEGASIAGRGQRDANGASRDGPERLIEGGLIERQRKFLWKLSVPAGSRCIRRPLVKEKRARAAQRGRY